MAAARADRLHERFVAWLTRGVLLVIAGGLVVFAGMLLAPAISWLAFALAGLLLVAGFASMFVAGGILIRWFFARRAFYQQLPSDKRREICQNELFNRGAPKWYIGASPRQRVAYVLSVILVAFVAVPLLLYSVHSSFVAIGLAPLAVLLLLGVLRLWVNRPARGRGFNPRLQVAAGETPVGQTEHGQQPGDNPADVSQR